MMLEEKLKYPIGQFKAPLEYSPTLIKNFISEIGQLPFALKQEVSPLSDQQLDTVYRAGGWTVRQVVHHLADSHMNALIRIKLALTEETPVIKPYHQEYWAQLPDSRLPLQSSLQILEGVHERWAALLKSLTEKEWNRAFLHPEKGREISMREAAASYAWHGNHHLAHITGLKARNHWK